MRQSFEDLTMNIAAIVLYFCMLVLVVTAIIALALVAIKVFG
jgi:hypothetical protein